MIKLLLRVLISVLVLFLLVGFVYALDPTRVYELNLLYEGGLVSVESMTVGFAYPPAEGFELINPYELKLLNVYGDLDYDYKFNFPAEVIITPEAECFNDEGVYDGSLCGGPESTFIELDKAILTIFVPYSRIGKEVKIYTSTGELAISFDVNEFSDYCGDNVCSLSETDISCSDDCKNMLDLSNKKVLWIGLTSLALLLIMILLIKRRK